MRFTRSFTRPFAGAVLAAALSGCVASMYEASPGKAPGMTVYAANRACHGSVQEAIREHPMPIVPGVLPMLAVMGGDAGRERQAAIHEAAASCMAEHGYVPR